MSASTSTTTARAAVASAVRARPPMLRPAPRKLLVLAVLAVPAAAVLAPRSGSGLWPGDLTVDLEGPLAHVSDWIIDNRDSHPLFLHFFGHVSNAVVVTVRGVYLVLLALGWPGVVVGATALAWRAAGLRSAAVTAVSLAVCGLLGMWIPTMQTIALMAVAVPRPWYSAPRWGCGPV